ncbi:MAG: arsenate reductase, glutathione/glutaredoxin type [Leptolyngbyaceae cyanobacterium SL_5_9]|nr:arsenate reductase, glutathione/glutaredoxin type [Leptolyngbyaceae cyanobacterium SL_5_9]NJO72320.1 arsenate reductase, glutathione/glutaredoxin type [Leptolyngbyaceae cyanobacterium RM1_406_9]
MKQVMFVCQHNSRRSQMAEGFARALGADKILVTSAGLKTHPVDPLAVQVMSEVGIDISQQTSKPLDNFKPEDYDAVISLCGCGVNLPQDWILQEVFEDWQLEDPAGKPIEVFRAIRDQIKEKVASLIQNGLL